MQERTEFVSRETVMRDILCEPPDAHYPSWYAERIAKIPAADVRPVVKAHWIYHEDDYGDFYECSHCHDEYVVYESDMEWKFCPTCGAEMSDSQTLEDAAQYADAGAMAPAT